MLLHLLLSFFEQAMEFWMRGSLGLDWSSLVLTSATIPWYLNLFVAVVITLPRCRVRSSLLMTLVKFHGGCTSVQNFIETVLCMCACVLIRS